MRPRSRSLTWILVGMFAAALLGTPLVAVAQLRPLEAPPLRLQIPVEWVNLSPGAPRENLERLPPGMRQELTKDGVIAAAAEMKLAEDGREWQVRAYMFAVTHPGAEVINQEFLRATVTSIQREWMESERTSFGALLGGASQPQVSNQLERWELVQIRGVTCARIQTLQTVTIQREQVHWAWPSMEPQTETITDTVKQRMVTYLMPAGDRILGLVYGARDELFDGDRFFLLAQQTEGLSAPLLSAGLWNVVKTKLMIGGAFGLLAWLYLLLDSWTRATRAARRSPRAPA